jgi:hypothetical protein
VVPARVPRPTPHDLGATVNARAAALAEASEPSTDSFGLPACDEHLIAKLRAMPDDLRAYILVPTTTRDIQLPKERP